MEAISAWIEEAAISLRDYQAVRWAWADLLQASAARSPRVQLRQSCCNTARAEKSFTLIEDPERLL